MKEGKDDYWRYRARVKLKFPETMGLKPFLYEEAFYEFGDKDDWNGNEAGCGFGIPLRDGLELVLDFRICHSLQDDSWGEGTLNVLSSFQVTF